MGKWQRILYQPALPLGSRRVTGSEEHIALSRKAAGEGMVLLKNETGLLPLAKGTKVALFGKGTVDYVKGGGGSGDVTVAYVRSLYEGMKSKEAEGKLSVYHELADFYEKEMKQQYENGALPGMTVEPEVPEKLLAGAKAFTDTAIISISRFSGEGWDRTCAEQEEGYELFEEEEKQKNLSKSVFENGDFYLTKAEQAMVELVKKNFSRIAVVLNVGGMVDTSWFFADPAIPSVLMAWQGGMEGGLAAADLLCGDVNPSGKLTDTFAASLEDYPSSANFHESRNYVEYTEDIYVGYRYFETVPGAAGKVNYPFGYGLSYTTFAIRTQEAFLEEKTLKFLVQVTNTGERAGREVVQIYYGAPQGKLGKPAKVLAAYRKTRLLQAGESQILKLEFPVSQMASYDDCGKVAKSAYVLEKGTYRFYVGNSVRNTEPLEFVYLAKQDCVTEQLTEKLAPRKLTRRMLANGRYEKLEVGEYREKPGLERQDLSTLEGILPGVRARAQAARTEKDGRILLEDVAEGRADLDAFTDQLSNEDLIHLLGGQPNTGVANTFGMGNLPEYGVPNVMTADGPAGLRIAPQCGVTTTAWPCATLVACTWDPEIAEAIGEAGAREVKENNIGIWLTPAVNIHRSPLCGRNFEYYSEDPLVAGKTGAAAVRGIQSQHIGASVKHFAFNNKETDRKDSDSRVSERAAREIYLKAFEIIVKEAAPYTIMSSYNLVNGVHTSESRELLTDILRKEWGFDGIVTTDWWTHGEHYRETKAGNDIKMANGYPKRVMEALEKGLITREEIRICAKRILQMILKMD